MCLHAYACGCLAQADGPVIPFATILTLTLGGSRAYWFLSLLNMASWWLQGLSLSVCAVKALSPSKTDLCLDAMGLYSSQRPYPSGILSST